MGLAARLRETAFLEKASLELAELLIEEVVGLVNDADQRVGSNYVIY